MGRARKPSVDRRGHLVEAEPEPAKEEEVTHVRERARSRVGRLQFDKGGDRSADDFIQRQYFGGVLDSDKVEAETKSDVKEEEESSLFEEQYFQKATEQATVPSGNVDFSKQFDYLEGGDRAVPNLEPTEEEAKRTKKPKKARRKHARKGRVVSQPWDMRAAQRGELADKVPNPALVDPEAFRTDPLTTGAQFRSPLGGALEERGGGDKKGEDDLGTFDEAAWIGAQEEHAVRDKRIDPLSVAEDIWSEQTRTLASVDFPLAGDEHKPEALHPHWDQRNRDRRHKEELERIDAVDRDGSLRSLYDIWRHIPDLSRAPRHHVVHMLKQRVVYRDKHLLAINKPYGLYSMGGPRAYPNVLAMIKPMRRALAPDADAFRLMHRLDKVTTGVMLFALSEEKIDEIKRMFIEKRILKKYVCITRGVPDVDEGTVDVPLAETRVGRRFKMAPTRPYGRSTKYFQAATDYRVLSRGGGSGNQAALVQCDTHTGRKHQIRVHMGVCLERPILGDDKYTELMSFRPQRLRKETLQMLGIRSARSRDLPVYLHAQEVQIPNFATGKNTVIRAPLPRFFVETAKKLRLILPK